MRVRSRTNAVVLVALRGVTQEVRANPVLLRLHGAPPARVIVEQWSGRTEARLNAVTPSRDITIALLIDGLSPAEIRDAAQQIAAIYSPTLRVALVQGGAVRIAGPFAAKSELENALNAVSAGGPVGRAGTVETLIANAPLLGGNWSALVAIGRLAAPDPGTAEYIAAALAQALAAQKVRLFAAATDDDTAAIWRRVAVETGGAVAKSVADLSSPILTDGDAYREVGWDEGTLPHGFQLYKAKLTDATGALLAEAPGLVLSADPLPTTALYSELRQRVAQAAALAGGAYDQAGADRIRTALGRALSINPRDEAALRLASAIYEHASDFPAAAKFWSDLAEVAPTDWSILLSLAKCQLRANALDDAERTIAQARQRGAPPSAGVIELAQIHVRRGDRAGAVALLGQTGNALAELRGAMPSLPRDAAIRASFAQIFEDLHASDDALAAWRFALDADVSYEPAQYAIARLLLARGDAKGAIHATESGAASARIYLLRAEGFRALNEEYQRRVTLRQAAKKFAEPDVLRALAESEDAFPGGGSAAWRDAAAAIEKTHGKPEDLQAVLRRGLIAALRDNNAENVAWFGGQLSSNGDSDFANRLTHSAAEAQETTRLPGGAEALAFLAGGKDQQPPDRVFAEYCRTVSGVSSDTRHLPEVRAYLESIETYFETLRALEAFRHHGG